VPDTDAYGAEPVDHLVDAVRQDDYFPHVARVCPAACPSAAELGVNLRPRRVQRESGSLLV
jgi:hypothetical protein